MKFKEYLQEQNLTIKDLEDLQNKRFRLTRDQESNLNFLVDYYYESPKNEKTVNQFLKMVSNVIKKVKNILKKYNVPYIDFDDLKLRMFDWEYVPSKEDEFFPVPVYVSASKSDKNTVGISIHKNGKIEMFEGNDLASNETYDLVNKLIGKKPKEVEIWSSQPSKIINIIRRTKKLPEGIYVSPSRKYASGFWGENRILFSAKILDTDVRKESDIDWKVIGNPKIRNLRIY